MAEIQRWAELHRKQIEKMLLLRKKRSIPHAITLARMLRKIPLAHLPTAFAAFINALLHEQSITAVDGKAAKQMTDKNGSPVLMINIFAQKVKVLLAGDAIYAQRPLLDALHQFIRT